MEFLFDGRHLLICFIVAIVAFIAGAYYGWILKEESNEDHD